MLKQLSSPSSQKRRNCWVIVHSSGDDHVSNTKITGDSSSTSNEKLSYAAKTADVGLIELREGRIVTQSNSSQDYWIASDWAYADVTEALQQLRDASPDDDWKIEKSVYDASMGVEALLAAGGYPAPKVFSHSPTSVVFCWDQLGRSVYVTVSSNRIAALASSPEGIERRVKISSATHSVQDFFSALTGTKLESST